MDRAALASSFVARKPDRFEDFIQETAEVGAVDQVSAGFYPVYAFATRATYVLAIGDELAYAGLRVADGFGPVGRLDLVLPDPSLAKITDDALVRYDLREAVRVHRGTAAQVVPGINGPYDLIAARITPRTFVDLYEPIVRLLRTGGSLLIGPWERPEAAESAPDGESEMLERLNDDPRLHTYLPATESPLIAVRRR